MRVDGRGTNVAGCERGSFVRPTILEDLPPESEVARTEIFGPVLALIAVDTVEQAIERINSGAYGNMACLFTSSGRAARQFRYEAEVGNVGINVGVAAPMAYFPFSAGPRMCVGNHFTMIEAQLAIAVIAQRFRLDHRPGHLVERDHQITMRPRHGMQMLLRRRDEGSRVFDPHPQVATAC